MMCVDVNGAISPVKLKLERESFEKRYQQIKIVKDVMHLIETNHQINMTS